MYQGMLKHFIWKDVHEILPTKTKLYDKHFVESPNCSICLHEEESVCRVLWCCSTATNDMWSNIGSPIKKWSNIEETFMDLWLSLIEKLSCDDLQNVVMIM